MQDVYGYFTEPDTRNADGLITPGESTAVVLFRATIWARLRRVFSRGRR